MNRRLSSVHNSSDSAGSSPTVVAVGDGGFSYEGTPDRIRKIDVNSMAVFGKSDPKPTVMVFSGDRTHRKDVNNNAEIAVKTPRKIDHTGWNGKLETSSFVRRDKHRRKSRDQRRQFFNQMRNIDGDAIDQGTPATEQPVEEFAEDASKSNFEMLLEEMVLDRPSDILPSFQRSHQYDPYEDVVSSSTGMRPVTVPLLERFSEIVRTAARQRGYAATETVTSEIETTNFESSKPSTVLIMFVGLSSALVFGICLYYVGFGVPQNSESR